MLETQVVIVGRVVTHAAALLWDFEGTEGRVVVRSDSRWPMWLAVVASCRYVAELTNAAYIGVIFLTEQRPALPLWTCNR